ncbi:hypothetical protein MKX01_028861 [Papaver californicum]|nr:hypothetical protein MKX01_028861 [Papaver californicum]
MGGAQRNLVSQVTGLETEPQMYSTPFHRFKFLRRRVMSRVQIAVRKQIKSEADTMFYDLVEVTLQNDQDF